MPTSVLRRGAVAFHTHNQVPLKLTRYARIPIVSIDPREMENRTSKWFNSC